MSDPFSTHLPLLLKIVNATKGDVLEMGIGTGSTPALHEICAAQGRRLVSLDNNPRYVQEFAAKYQSPLHEFHVIEDWTKADIEKPWSVAFVDQKPAISRHLAAGRLANHAEYVVCHDTEPEMMKKYHFSRIFPLFRCRFDDALRPRTTVLSNLVNLDWLIRAYPDLTVLHYTANHLDDTRPHFVKAVREQMFKAVGDDYPMIAISQKPMPDFPGEVICLGDIGRSPVNIYRQILVGAKACSTPFVACCEDDVFYNESFFRTHRPPMQTFAYNFNRWGCYTWSDPPVFSYKNRPVCNQLIAPRELLIEALEERFAKYPDPAKINLKYFGEPGRYEKHLGVTVREWEPFAIPIPNIVFSHSEALDYLRAGKRKALGPWRRAELPFWGTAQGMMDLWNGQ